MSPVRHHHLRCAQQRTILLLRAKGAYRLVWTTTLPGAKLFQEPVTAHALQERPASAASAKLVKADAQRHGSPSVPASSKATAQPLRGFITSALAPPAPLKRLWHGSPPQTKMRRTPIWAQGFGSGQQPILPFGARSFVGRGSAVIAAVVRAIGLSMLLLAPTIVGLFLAGRVRRTVFAGVGCRNRPGNKCHPGRQSECLQQFFCSHCLSPF